MTFVRIDNRLIHGQIIETWLPYTGAKVVVVANDGLASDVLQQEIMSLAIPHSVESVFVTIDDLADMVEDRQGTDDRAMIILFSGCADAKRAYECGFSFEILNIGNVHYSPGKKQISPSVALSADDESCLKLLSKKGVELDFRCVPNDPVQVRF